ncbi:MAG: B12-binding domain-containing radical SAM protein [Oscillospiraceae bacterium]|nr:B12-binding domain-containing radical SAM protein [Oscillospiraceae bacterium]
MKDIMFVTSMEQPELHHEVNGTLLLATRLLKAGFETDILHFWEAGDCGKDYEAFIKSMTERLLVHTPGSVAFYCVWTNYHIMLRIAAEVKRAAPETVIVLGGPQASATARDTLAAMPHVDYICTGEGENTVVPFFTALLRDGGQGMDTIPGLFYRKDGQIVKNDLELPLCDLDAEPRWDERLFVGRYEESPEKLSSDTYYMPIDAGRGCPYNCTFCCTSHFWRRTYRMKSAERIVADIRYFKERFGIRSFWFSHDAFTINHKLVEQVCDYIIEQDLDICWRCSTRIDCITEELLMKMKQAGMTDIEVGIETGSKRMQKLTNKRLDLERAQEKIRFMLKNGLRVSLFFMYGFPEETEADLNDTLELMFTLVDMGVQSIIMAYTRFNPATQIAEDHMDELILDPKIKVLTRAVFGYEEEKVHIAQHKTVFPFFYHLGTPVRENFQYVIFFTHVYRQFPNAARYLRKLYEGDNLRFYRDFCEVNESCFAEDMDHATREVVDNPLELMENMLQKFDGEWVEQLRGLMRYDWDQHRVSKSKEDISLQETYDFVIMDLQRRRPIQQFAKGKTTLVMEKKNGVARVKILDVR